MPTTIEQIAWIPFRLPYATVFATAHGVERARAGVLLRLSTSAGLEGLGEASPVTSFNAGTVAEALGAIERLAPSLIGQTLDQADALLHSWSRTEDAMSAVACAFDTALCDLRAQARRIPLAQLLGGDTGQPIAVHAPIGTIELAATCAAAAHAIAQGFRCIKLKVGSCGAAEAELERIGAVRRAIGPQIRLRIDANGAWEPAAAITILRAATRYDIELVEQPVAATDLTGMRRVRACVDIPIAADESVAGVAQARRVVAAEAADLLVVKPMLAGGLRAAFDVIAIANAAHLGAFVTTTIDAGVANAAARQLATTLPQPRLACGLATGQLLAADLITPALAVCQGTISIPDRPGLGIALDPAQLARYGDGWREVPKHR